MGETIPIELAFSSSEPGRWKLDNAQSDRSGRVHEEVYHLDPADGAVDPLREYFEQGTMGGGLYSTPTLTTQPQILHFDLNEWHRIDRPGKYRLYATSSRLQDETRNVPGQRGQVLVDSNLVEFEVLPADEQWQRDQLARATKTLATGGAGDEARQAIRRLRFLATPEVAPELARHFNGSNRSALDWECMFGLFAVRDRAAAIRAMRQRLVAPDQPVTAMYLRALGQLETWAAGAARAPPPPNRPCCRLGGNAVGSRGSPRWPKPPPSSPKRCHKKSRRPRLSAS